MPKITKRMIDALQIDASRRIYWDSELKGFGLIVLPSGVRSFILQYRNKDGRQRRLTLGRYGVITPDQGRKAAQLALARVLDGEDPVTERRTARAAPLLDDLLDRYLAEHVDVHNATRTRADVRATLTRHVRPRLGALKAAAVTREDVSKLHHALQDTPRTANFCLAILSKAFNLAADWGMRPKGSNPCEGIRRYDENSRERFINADELSRLGQVLHEVETIGLPWRLRQNAKGKHRAKEGNQRVRVNPGALAAIRLALFTGARISEILELRWEHVDFEACTLALPERKGGKRRRHPVSAAAMEIIYGISRIEGSPWVLSAPKDATAHLSIFLVEKAWRRIRACAGLDDVRIHDLRHTVGTYASQSGVNAFAVRDLLRHTNTLMTNRYVQRDAEPIRALSEEIGQRIAEGLATKPIE
ncbi:MAG: DUF4102 domain-containing protein [Hyphomicrobiales bacterium]|nr:MAG: DUF4102 domain-containing protein [Hyphomicrobiales bacterium]